MRLQRTVRNVVNFGAFVDIGLKHDALLHRSQMRHRQAKIAPQHIGSPMEILDLDGLVQSQLMPECIVLPSRCFRAKNGLGRVARRDLHERKDNQTDTDKYKYCLQ